MFEDIQKHRQAVRENIEKSLQIGYTESEDFEKAHKVGDVHPNGKWVWTQLPSGKFDWRVIKVKPQANTGGGSGIMGKTAPKSAVQNNPSLSAKQQAIQKQMATQSQKKNPAFKIVPDTYLKHGNRSKKDFEGLYQTAYDSYKNMSDQDLWDKREKVIKTYQNAVVMYSSMKRTASATQLNKQGNDVDKLAAEVYILNHLLGEQIKLPEVKFTSSDFKKEKMEREEGDRKDALQLYWHVGPKTEYYDDDGKKKTATPEINEFYSDNRQKHLGGYEIHFDYAEPIGSFRTLNEAIAALNDWVNKKRVKNHPKPKWIYNQSKGDYQMNFKL